MTTPAKFFNFSTALMAAQSLTFHYAQAGLFCSLSASKASGTIKVSVFHDEQLIIDPPTGYMYSGKEEGRNDGYYWTDFKYEYDD